MEVSLAVSVEECKNLVQMEDAIREETCRAGRVLMQQDLEAKDEALRRSEKRGLRCVGKRRRTVTAMLGDVTFERCSESALTLTRPMC